jgi:transposase-like protein
LLVVIDGGKGLRSAVRQVFQKRALVQRCMWHKRENVVSYLPKSEQAQWRRRLQRAYDRPTYKEAHAELTKLHRALEGRNQSAAASLAEGLEETLTLHRLGVYAVLGVSFKTTNCLESTNALVEEHCAKVNVWKNSNQRHRWLATALLDVEPRLRRVKGHRHLPKLEAALRQALNVKERSTKLGEAA